FHSHEEDAARPALASEKGAPKSSPKEFFLNREPRERRETSGFFASFAWFAVHSVFYIGTDIEGTCLARSSFRFAVVKRGSGAPSAFGNARLARSLALAINAPVGRRSRGAAPFSPKTSLFELFACHRSKTSKYRVACL